MTVVLYASIVHTHISLYWTRLEKYVFPITSGYRNLKLPDKLAGVDVDLNSLGFNALITEAALKPGKYRTGFIFKDSSGGSAYYWDKPASYLVKTPNTIRGKTNQ